MLKPSTNVEALEATLSELDGKRGLGDIDAAQVQMVRSMAYALDAEPSNAALWRQYREALGGLTADDDAGGAAGDDLFPEVGNQTST